MAIGTGWADGAWVDAGWIVGAWSQVPNTGIVYTTLMDAIRAATGGGTINDGMVAHFGKASTESLNDAIYRWLGEQGATGTTVEDRWRSFLTAQGYSGAFQDQLLQYWNNV